jgi:hypothetical protein
MSDNDGLNISPFAKGDDVESAKQFSISTSLEFLLNKKLHKKILGNSVKSLQTVRENEERLQYMVKYKTDLLKLFGDMLENPDKTMISQEIRNIFESFVDKSVKYFIRTDQMLNPVDYEKDEDDQYEDESPKSSKKMPNKKRWSGCKEGNSNWGDNISLIDTENMET